MAYKRLTITFPEELARRVRQCARNRGFSAYVAEAAREKLVREDKETLKRRMSEGYALSAKEDQRISDEWDALTGEGL